MAREQSSRKKAQTTAVKPSNLNERVHQLRNKIAQVTTQIETSKLTPFTNLPNLQKTLKAGTGLSKEITAFGRKGLEFTNKIKGAILRQDLSELRGQIFSILKDAKCELEQRTEELRHKGKQLGRLLRTTGVKAVAILQSEPKGKARKMSSQASS